MNYRGLEQIYHAALELPPSERSGFLDENCGDDDALHRKLRSMLEIVEKNPRVLVLPGQTPEKIGNYRIESVLGRGGMSVVYLGQDPILKRFVAIKVLSEMLSNDRSWLQRFEREAQVLASLKHPNVATVHSFEEAEGYRFLTMEYVEGESLASRIERDALSIREAMEVGLQIASGMHEAHSRGIVHRDLKPANIMLDNQGLVKIVDFGIAKSLTTEESSSPDSPSSHASGPATNFAGTPGYMSPEQWGGHSADHRTDIFAFGCVLYESMTGCRVFEGTDVSWDSKEALKLIPRGVPRAIRELIRDCLQSDPDLRIDSMATIRDRLSRALERRRYSRASRVALGVVLVAAMAVFWPIPESCEWPDGGRLVFRNWIGIPIAWPETGSRPGLGTSGGTLDGRSWTILPKNGEILPVALAVWGDEGSTDILALLNWRGKVLRTWRAHEDPALGHGQTSKDFRWAAFHLRETTDGRPIVLTILRSISGPLTVIRPLEKRGNKVEPRAFAWQQGHLEYFPEVDANGDNRPDQLALGWAQYLAADGTERRDLPEGERGRNVAYVLDLDALVDGDWGELQIQDVPSLVESEAVDYGLVVAWSFPLDEFTTLNSTTCKTARITGVGELRFSCIGGPTYMAVEYVLRSDVSFTPENVQVDVISRYRDELLNRGWSREAIRAACDRLSRQVIWKRRDWRPVVPAD